MSDQANEATSITLGGIPLEGGNAYEWRLQAGVAPYETLFTVTDELALRFADKIREPLDLVISGPRSTMTAKLVYITEILPGSKTYLRRLRVADRRWLWPRRWLASTFNLRRTRGRNFLIKDDGKPIENAINQEVIEYAKFSLHPPGDSPSNVWSATQVLEYLISAPIGEGLGSTVKFAEYGGFTDVEFHDLIVDDQGHHAVERVIAMIPGADIFVDLDGDVVIYNTASERDAVWADRLRENGQLWTGPDARVTDRKLIAPRSVVSLFTVESEFRFDFAEEGTVEKDTPVMFNVLASPDAELTLLSGKTVARGSYVTLDDAFAAWGAFGLFKKQGVSLSYGELRANYLKAGGGFLTRKFGASRGKPQDPVALARIQSTLRAWRKLFRVDRTFLDRLEVILPIRAGVMNTETGTRAPAEAFVDYMRMPSWKNLANAASPNQKSGVFVRGYNARLENAKTTPAGVAVIDSDAGIIGVIPRLDPYGAYQQMVLGYPNDDQNIVSIGGHADANRTGIEGYARWGMIELDTGHKTAVVASIVPATPNNSKRFFAVEVTAASQGLDYDGPTMHSRVFPGVMSAMFLWSDDKKTTFVNAVKGQGGWDQLTEQCFNLKDVQNVAEANAKRVYETWRDRPLGGIDVDLDPEVEPTGSLSSVRHVMSGGATVTQARFTGLSKPVQIWRYLNSSTRRVVLRTLNNGVGQ